ncbi:hypothetical protein [Chryseobacterium indologenes]|uniref:hypothetical protein n=1 Tax=Chryseobacterium indologenes TaxID=253 RepID=UPI00076E3F30|nr:hypothetical protein [Chryseobacterium indologenes]
MNTVIDGKEWILSVLNADKPMISGSIYIDKRPSVSKEDIVINSITMTGNTFQTGVFNVNCYVPNLSINVGGVITQVPDRIRLKTISSHVAKVLKSVYKTQKYNISIENTAQFEEEAEKSSYINFRININAFNN